MDTTYSRNEPRNCLDADEAEAYGHADEADLLHVVREGVAHRAG